MLGQTIELSTSFFADFGDEALREVFTSMADRVQTEMESIQTEKTGWFVAPEGSNAESTRVVAVPPASEDYAALFESNDFIEAVVSKIQMPSWLHVLCPIDDDQVTLGSPTLGIFDDHNVPGKNFFIKLPQGAPLSHLEYALQDLTTCISDGLLICIDWPDVVEVAGGGMFIYHCYEFNPLQVDFDSACSYIRKILCGKGNTLFVFSFSEDTEWASTEAIQEISSAVSESLRDDANIVFTGTFPVVFDPYCRISFFVRP